MTRRIREGWAGDVHALTALYNHYVGQTAITFDLEPFTVEQRAQWLGQHAASGPHRLFVAELGGAVVGYASSHRFRIKPAYDTTVESSIYVAPEAQGRGVGRELYTTLLRALDDAGVHCVVAGITLPNVASVALHERCGFEPAGVMREVGWKHDRFWDVAWYQRLAGGERGSEPHSTRKSQRNDTNTRS